MEHEILRLIELIALAIEVLSVVVIVSGVTLASVRHITVIVAAHESPEQYYAYKAQVARSLLLGLEILIAADVIRTIALTPTIENLLGLGLLALIRTFLSWSLIVEVEGHWPWQPEPKTHSGKEM